MLAGLVAAAVVPKPLVALTLQPPTVPLLPEAALRVYYNRVFIKYLYDSLSQGIEKDWSESRSFVEREAV
jgi:hypothetical protein